MAAGRIVISQYSPARDRSDRLVAGAKLYVYTNGTTTPASIFSDSGLSVPMANPVVANSSGAFASIWASDAVLYTVSVTGPNGESIGNPSVFDDYAVNVDWFSADAAEASAVAAAASASAASGSASAASSSASTASTAASTATSAASTATTQATSATNSATSADADADRAEAAANVATALGNMYASTVAGLAATASGGYFSVEPDANGIIYCYRDDAGVATEIGRDYVLGTDHKDRNIVPPVLLGHSSQGLKLRKALSDIRAGTRSALKIMVLGDSLAGISWSDVHVQLMKVLEGHMTSTPIYAHSISVLDYGTFSDSAAASTTPRNYTGTWRFKQDYDAAWDGTLMSLAAGQASNFSIGGGSVQCDKIYIPIITEPGAGTVKIELANVSVPPALGGAWSNVTAPQIISGHTLTGSELLVDANAAFGVNMVVLSVDLGWWAVKVTQTAGGTVRVRHPMQEVTTAAAFNVWRVGSASNDFVLATTSAVTIETAQIAAYDPDVIVVECADDLPSYENFLPKLEAAINAAGLTHNPLVLLVQNPFYSNGPFFTDATIIARAEYCYNFAATRLGWDVLDGMALSGGLAEATRAGWENDGIHYSNEIAYWIAHQWAATRGYLPQQAVGGGRATRAQVLSAPVTNATGAMRTLSAEHVAPIMLATGYDTSHCTWAGAVSGSATFTANNAGDKTLTTGATASSGVGAYINQNGSLIGIHTGNIRGESRGFGCRIRTTTTWDAQTLGFILQRTDAVAYNSGYNGTLAGQGWGFRLSFDGTNILIHGICWLSGALVVSSGSAILQSGPASYARDIAVLCKPAVVSAVTGTLEWFVGGVSIGTSNYDHGGVFLAPRVELTNGSTAANQTLQFMPPKFLSAPQ